MRINVTQEHIDNGQREACRECPVALAIVDALTAASGEPPKYIEVNYAPSDRRGWTCAWVTVDHETLMLPSVAGDAIRDFDMSGDMAPFAFDLDIEP